MKKKEIISVSVMLALTLLFSPVKIGAESETESPYTDSTYTTPYLEDLPISRYKYAAEQLDYPDLNLYHSAEEYDELESEATNLYNCFSFAFIYDGNVSGLSEMPRSDNFVLNEPYLLIRSQNPCYEYVDFDDVKKGDIAIYGFASMETFYGHKNIIHAGIVDQKGDSLEETYIISKWGEYSIYRHTIVDCPYKGISIRATEFDDLVEQNTIKVSFARMTHTYTYYYKTSDNKTIQSNTYHKLRCSGCGAFHFEAHEEDEFEAIIVTVGKLTNSTQHKVCCDCGYYRTEAHTYSSSGVCIECEYSPLTLYNLVVEDLK